MERFAMHNKTKIGIIGCGNISGIYLKVAKTFDILETVACADVIPELAKAKADEYGVPCACMTDDLLTNPEICIVVNLTPPAAHGAIALQALQAGKSVFNEKPLAVTREDAQRMLALACERNLRVGCAPDTFMGAGLQTCRKLIDEGAIGRPIAATAFMLGRGPEPWHPNPEFFYQAGGGPMFDMGPYYVTALVTMLGPVKRVTGSAQVSFPERTIGSGAKQGKKFKVEIPTHIVGVLDFAGGVVGNIITSFDVWAHQLPRIEIYGTDGSLSVPDPNTFGGPVKLWKPETRAWEEVPLLPIRAENSRSLGVADMAYALRSGRPHRANGELAYHVLDIMHAIHDASRENRHFELTSTCERPIPMPVDLSPNVLDE
jgi:predicted dehydrogenase